MKQVGTIGNYYGGLFIRQEGEHYQWSIEDYDDSHQWEEIPLELYQALLAFEIARKALEEEEPPYVSSPPGRAAPETRRAATEVTPTKGGTMFRATTTILGGLLAIWLLLNLTVGGGLLHWRFWASEYRDAQREVFEGSQSYVQGKVTYLSRLRLSYEEAEGSQREALRRTILIEASTVDVTDLPEPLQNFLATLSPATGDPQT